MIYSEHSKQLLASERKKIHHRTIYRQDWVERDGTPLAEEDTGSKRPDIIGPGQLALGWWVRWGGGMGTGSEREGGGVFFTADLC
jgi:hypothetical protein